MRTITIRECAIDALAELRNTAKAGALLLATCSEALGAEAPDLDADAGILCDYGTHALSAIHAAIAPDIVASVRDEGPVDLGAVANADGEPDDPGIIGFIDPAAIVPFNGTVPTVPTTGDGE